MDDALTADAAARRRVVLVHGAASGPWAFDGWAGAFPDDDVRVPDLQEGVDVARASMSDYADRVLAAAGAGPAVLIGWSMGGLVAMMAARRRRPVALVVLEPSVPAEVDGGNPDWPMRIGTYDAESTYGAARPGARRRPESLLARCERKRGISVPAIDCPFLVVAGRDYGATRGRPVAERYGAELAELPEISHGGLVSDPRVRDAVARWVRSQRE